MRRFLISLAALAATASLGSQAVRAQSADTALAAAPPQRASSGPAGTAVHSRAADSAAVRLVPVKLRSPGGVRIRSVRDNRRVVIIAPPMRIAGAASQPDTVSRTGTATRDDLDRLEARLQTYFDERIRGLEISQREVLLSLSPRAAGPTGLPHAHDHPGATEVIGAPFIAPASAPPDTAAADTALAADSTRRAALAAARDTSGAAFFGFKPPSAITLLGPGAGITEIERAMLEGDLLRVVNVIFEFDSAELLPASLPILNALGTVLAKHPDLLIEIGGHTDSSGPDEYNVRLSLARAEAVRKHLVVALSIAGDRLTARGYGESMPIADESTPTGRALNRRVEFLVLRPGERRETPPPADEEYHP